MLAERVGPGDVGSRGDDPVMLAERVGPGHRRPATGEYTTLGAAVSVRSVCLPVGVPCRSVRCGSRPAVPGLGVRRLFTCTEQVQPYRG